MKRPIDVLDEIAQAGDLEIRTSGVRRERVTINGLYEPTTAAGRVSVIVALAALYPTVRFSEIIGRPDIAAVILANPDRVRDGAIVWLDDFARSAAMAAFRRAGVRSSDRGLKNISDYDPARQRLRDLGPWLPNIWRGGVVADQDDANAKLGQLMKLSGNLFAVYTEARGPIDFRAIALAEMPGLKYDTLGGVIYGNAGEQVGPPRRRLGEIIIGSAFGRLDKVRRGWRDAVIEQCNAVTPRPVFRRASKLGSL